MAAGEKLHASNLKLAGYLKLLDNPVFLGLSDNAYISTVISSSSLDITNLSGDIDINANNVYLNTSLISSPGLFKYQGQYWGSYDNRTLVDKEYVDNQISLVGVSYWDVETSGELTLNPGVPGPVLPHTTNSIDLGKTSLRWNDLYINGSIDVTSTLNLKVSGSNIISIISTGASYISDLSGSNSSNPRWIPDKAYVDSVAGGSSFLANLLDVEFTTGKPDTGEYLVFNGTKWESAELPVSFTISGTRNNASVTDQYLRIGDTPSNLAPYILPENCMLKYMSLSCATAGTWTAEVHVNGILISGAVLSVTGNTKAYIKFLTPISFNAGDEVELYLNGTGINRPRINAIFISVP